MAPKQKVNLPPELKRSGGRERKTIERFGDKEKDSPMPRKSKKESKETKLLTSEGGLTQGEPLQRCKAVLELMALRPDAAWFDKPVSAIAVPDYATVVTSPSARLAHAGLPVLPPRCPHPCPAAPTQPAAPPPWRDSCAGC